MKIATWNINSINSRIEHVVDWCKKNQPDVLCLQETKCVDAKFPHGRFSAIGYEHCAFLGEKAYNGVAIISKEPLQGIQKNLPDDKADSPKRLIAAKIGNVHILNAYVPHGTKLGSDKFAYKLKWLERLGSYLSKNFRTTENVILCGDLNIAPHELDVWKPSLWKDKIHFTKAERDALQTLKRWGFVDVFRQINDDLKEYSWWDYFHHSFEKDHGLRIDHIWASPPLAERCTDCWIDKSPRELDKPSDHAPVIAEFHI